MAFRLKPRMSSTSSIGASPKCTFLIGARGFICFSRFDSSSVSSSRDEVGLGQQDPVGEAHLLLRLVELVELLRRVLGVDQRDDRVEQVVVADLLVDEEGLRHRAGVGHAGGLDHHAVELELALVALLLQRAEDADQVAAHRAADAAVVHLDDLLLAPSR